MIEDFQNLFTQKMKERGLSLQKISEMSGIAVKHLENLRAGRFDALPPSPYLRGYLIKLGNILDFDGEAWWETLRTQGLTKSSGPADQLPKNRFAKEPLKKKIWWGLLGTLLLLYLGFRLPHIFGTPALTVRKPSDFTSTVAAPEFTVEGALRGADELYINGNPVLFDAEGRFSQPLVLEAGLNVIDITAKKFLGRETKTMRQIIYEPPRIPTSTLENLPE